MSADATRRVEAYFTGVAATYHSASQRAAWKLVRQREATSLMALAGDVTGQDVLELGSGAGFYTRLLLAAGARHVVAVDLSQRMLDELPRDGVTPVCADATTVDPGRRFRHLLTAGMLEFVDDPQAALANAALYAEPGATLAVLVPKASLLGRLYRRFHAGHGLTIGLFDTARLSALGASTGWQLDSHRRAGPYSMVARLVRSSAS